MKKQFCDVCGTEFELPFEFSTVTANGKGISFRVQEISVAPADNVPNIHHADVCVKCLAVAMENVVKGVDPPSWIIPF